MYLAVVMDLYSRGIIGWALDTQMADELTHRALKMALEQRGTKPGLIVHSDRGVKCIAQGCQDLLSRMAVVPYESLGKMVRENDAMESLFCRLKWSWCA